MFKFGFLILTSFITLIFAYSCSSGGGSGGGGGGGTTYRYSVTGSHSMTVASASAAAESVSPLAVINSTFTIRYNIDNSGNTVTGTYTDTHFSPNGSPVTGTIAANVPTMTVTFASATSGVKSLVFNNVVVTGNVVTGDVSAYGPGGLGDQIGTTQAFTGTITDSGGGEDDDDDDEDDGGGNVGNMPNHWDSFGKIACYSTRVNGSSVKPGFITSVMIDKSGDVWAWGTNTVKALGLPTEQTYTTPTKITFPGTPGKFVYVTLGNAIGAAIDENGKLYAWSGFAYPTSASTVNNPTEITNLPMGLTPVQIAFSKSNMYILDTAGKVWTAGGDTHQQMGNGAGDTSSTTLTAVQDAAGDLSGVARIYAHPSDDSIFVLKTDQTLWGWGQGTGYRFDPIYTTAVNKATRLFTAAGAGFIHFSRDYASLMAVHTNGKAYTWGNAQGTMSKLGRSTVMSQGPNATETFARVGGGSNPLPAFTLASAFTSGIGEMTYMVGTDKNVYKWGTNVFGDGLGHATNYPTGVDVTPVSGFPNDVISMHNCGDMIYAVKDDGTVLATGHQFNGALGNGVDDNVNNALTFVPVGSLDLKD